MASSPGRVARIGPIWASSVACRATVFGGEYGVKYLCREVLLDLDGFVEHGIGVVIGGLGSLVGRGRQHVLTDNDRREQAVRLC